MLPIVMNTSFERLAAIDTYTSFIWATRYYACGDFELCVDASLTNINLFKEGYYVCREDDEHVGIVEDIKIQRNEDGQELMIIKGRFLESIIGRRIISQQTILNGTLSDCINALLTNEIINPSIPERQIDNFVLGAYTISQTMQAQYTGKNLLEVICAICETYGIGFKVTLVDYDFVFTLFEGVDRSYNQSVNPYVVFSDTYDNLLSSEYEENYQGMVTNVLVGGEGEGLDRKTVWVTVNNPSGLNRYEAWKDARNVRSNDGEISDEAYTAMLHEDGLESITEYTTAFAGTVYFGNITWKTDVNIGDICTIENSRWGISINSRLVEVIESMNEAGEYSIIPTFGL